MLYRYSEVFRSLLMASDVALVAGAWLLGYWLRFNAGIPAPLGIPPFEAYLPPLLVICPVWLVLFRTYGLYEPRRMGSLLSEAGVVLRATAVGVMFLVAVTFFVRSYFFSRGVMAAFAVLAPIGVMGSRVMIRSVLRSLRRRGYNLRYVLVVGGGVLAAEVVARIQQHPAAGLRLRGVLTEHPGDRQGCVQGAPILGGYSSLKEVLRSGRTDQVILALPRDEGDRLEKVLAELDDELTTVQLVPDVPQMMTLRKSIEDLDGLPIINLRESPMVGWAAVQKRLFDIAVSAVALTLAAPLFALVALAIGLGSGRPILYRQQRMGLDGRTFSLIKFRSMLQGAEAESGPVWATEDDERRTRLGRWLRRFSLDELPQLWNVLHGDMSLVGPRPERPVFIEAFRREVPGYMLRHKVKAGMSGWAQVHGWRGNTSLHERVEHDIYYIQNWSLGLDVQIVLMTVWRVLFDRNAH